MTHTTYVRALIARERKIQEAELDAATKHLDECAERHAEAMRRVQTARARVAEARAAEGLQ